MNYEVGQYILHWCNGVLWSSKILSYCPPSPYRKGGYTVLLNSNPGNTMVVQDSEVLQLAATEELGMAKGSCYMYDNI